MFCMKVCGIVMDHAQRMAYCGMTSILLAGMRICLLTAIGAVAAVDEAASCEAEAVVRSDTLGFFTCIHWLGFVVQSMTAQETFHPTVLRA